MKNSILNIATILVFVPAGPEAPGSPSLEQDIIATTNTKIVAIFKIEFFIIIDF